MDLYASFYERAADWEPLLAHWGLEEKRNTRFENLSGGQKQRLFALDSLGDGGWLKALRLEGYAPRAPRRPLSLQQTLFPYHEALG